MAKAAATDTFDESRLTQTLPLPRMVEEQVLRGLDAIKAVNEVLLAQESGTPVRDLDKRLKEEAEKETPDLPQDVVATWTEAQDAYKVYREKVEVARNALRKELGEEEKSGEVTPEQKEKAQEIRASVVQALEFGQNYAKTNDLSDVLDYFKSIEVPNVGRKGSSTAGGKKPRVYVFIDGADTPKSTFGEAAKEVSTKEVPVSVGDLTSAWEAATGGEDGEFKFGDHTFRVAAKPKKSEQ